MEKNPYRVTDKAHAHIIATANQVAAAIASRDATIRVIRDTMGNVPEDYVYNAKEQAFVEPVKPDASKV